MSGRGVRLVLAAYLVVVLRITQWPEVADPSALRWLERTLLLWHERGLPEAVDVAVVEALANVVMFVPFGVLVLLATRWRRGVVVLAGALFSTMIELSQLLFFADRVATVQDVVMNTTGAVVGVAAWALVGVVASALPSRLARVTSDAGSTGPEGGTPDPPTPTGTEPVGLIRGLDLLGESRLEPVEMDLRLVFRAGLVIFLVASVAAGVLSLAGTIGPRAVWVSITGALLGLLALAWERRRRRRR